MDIGKEGNVFKVQEDGTIIRVGKIDEENNSLKKVKKPVRTIKGLNKAIIICLIALWGVKELIHQSYWWNDIYEYFEYFDWLSYIAILASIAILILLFARKIKQSFGLIALLIGIYCILTTAPWAIFNPYISRVCSLTNLAIIIVFLAYIYKISLIEKTKN
jgi:hypothetical protein